MFLHFLWNFQAVCKVHFVMFTLSFFLSFFLSYFKKKKNILDINVFH